MSAYFVLCIAAFFTSGLTLFSGFGLGTLLMPVFTLFFPVELAVALTAIVHLANNLFKLALLGKQADRSVVLRFGLPAIVAAVFGAKALVWFVHLPPILRYSFFGQQHLVMPVKLVVAVLMVFFALFELVPSLGEISFSKNHLPIGGILSGFFGGLSGNQGAFRSAFLLKSGLPKEQFIATGIVVACLVDFSRLAVYGPKFSAAFSSQNERLLAAAILSAFFGAFLGARLMKKVTLRAVQLLVAALLFVIAVLLGAGLI